MEYGRQGPGRPVVLVFYALPEALVAQLEEAGTEISHGRGADGRGGRSPVLRRRR